MNFGSDNFAGVHPTISASLTCHAHGFATPYSMSDLDYAVERRLGEIFERPVSVFYVGTGTASNCLALTSVAKPGGMAFAHHEAHIIVDECDAPGLYSNLRIIPISGCSGKMDTAHLRSEVERIAALDIHGGRPNVISVTQPTESGTIYSLEELQEISAIAKQHALPLHMDGAQFANGLVSLDCSPAEMTWKSGVDILSFGGTKNGCWCAEAVILFDVDAETEFAFIHKRAGQLFSKSRFVSAQLDAYLRDDLWLNLARHSNAMGAMLYDTIRHSKSVRLVREPQANEIFVILNKLLIAELKSRGVVFSEWPPSPEVQTSGDESICRFVTSFATTKVDVLMLRSILKEVECSL